MAGHKVRSGSMSSLPGTHCAQFFECTQRSVDYLSVKKKVIWRKCDRLKRGECRKSLDSAIRHSTPRKPTRQTSLKLDGCAVRIDFGKAWAGRSWRKRMNQNDPTIGHGLTKRASKPNSINLLIRRTCSRLIWRRPFRSSPRGLICRDEPRTFAAPTPARCRTRRGYRLFGHAAGWISNRAIGLVQVRLERRLMVQPSTAVDPNSAVRISALSRFFRIHKACSRSFP